MGSASRRMADWSEWEGELAGGEFPLERYLGGTDRSAVFRTLVSSGKAAIKLVPADHTQAAALVERWNRAATLSHPHLIRIIRTGTCAMADMSLAYLVMEYAEEDLAAALAERALSAEETHATLQPVADALVYLHGQGLAHGNLKPSNILAVNDAVKVSSDAVSNGDPAADVSALASIMVQALTQRTPTMAPGSGGEPVAETLPQPFREIARHCFSADPHLRWSSAQIAAWLRSWQQPLTINPASREPVSIAEARKRRIGYYFAAFALILLVAVIADRLVMHRRAAPAVPASVSPAVPKPEPTGQASVTAPNPIPAAREPQPHREIAAGPGVTHQVIPDIPAKARATVHGRVRIFIRVAVDPSGNVTDATVERGGSRYFERLTLAAARNWKFVPVENAKPRAWVLRFEITQAGTKVVSKETTAP